MPKLSASEYEELINSISENFTNSTSLRQFGRKDFGKDNLWIGASGFEHQIDASLESDEEIILIECKYWSTRIKPSVFFDFFGRLIDIKDYPNNKRKIIRGVIVTKTGWQSGVEKAIRKYSEFCSIYKVNDVSQIEDMIHTHYISVPGIQVEVAFGNHAIIQGPANADNDGMDIKRNSPTDVTISWNKKTDK